MHPTSLAESGRKGTRRANEGPKGKWTVTYSSGKTAQPCGAAGAKPACRAKTPKPQLYSYFHFNLALGPEVP